MAERLPSGKYRKKAYYTDENGKRKSKSFTAKTNREADFLAAQFLIERKHFGTGTTMTVAQAVDKLIELNSSIYSPSTVRAYRKTLKNWMTEIADERLCDLSDSMLQKWINNISREFSPKTVSCAYGLLCSCRKQFMPDVNFHVRLPKKEKKEIRIPQTEDIEAILTEAQGSPMYLAVLLGAQCGLRRSEMAALTWKDIDMKKRKIKVNKAMVQGDDDIWYVKAPKSYSGYRVLDMTDRIYEYLRTADPNQPPVNLNPNTITKRFRILCTRAGIDFNEHLLRHYFCSVCCNLGLPEAVTVKLMGHRDASMVHEVYSHVLNEFEEQARATLSSYFNK